MTRKPVIFGGGAMMAGYVWAMANRMNRPLSPQLVAFIRREQMQRLKIFFHKMLFGRFAANGQSLDTVCR
jgi:hypothetical protein